MFSFPSLPGEYLLRFRVLGYVFWGPVVTPPHVDGVWKPEVWCFGWNFVGPSKKPDLLGIHPPISNGEVMGG